jgi:hypothetical protein
MRTAIVKSETDNRGINRQPKLASWPMRLWEVFGAIDRWRG